MLKKTGVKSYGNVTWLEQIHLILTVVIWLPSVVCWKILTNFPKLVNPRNFVKSVGLAAGRDLLGAINAAQIQKVLPTSVGVYTMWVTHQGLGVKVEELVDDTTLVWIGPKRTDKVILYAHGGAYIVPILHYSLGFSEYLRQSLKGRGHNVGLAILAYSLVPTTGLEGQITQMTRAIEHILASGVQPENLHLMGDSAGAQLILAFFSHLLHPLDNVKRMTLPSQIGGAYLMSPWSAFSTDSPSMKENADKDLLSVGALPEWMSHVAAQFTCQPPINPFTSPASAPEGWFKGLDALVRRVLVTGGTDELFRDDIKTLAEKLEKEKGRAKVSFVLQPGGVHIDPAVDFLFMLNPKKNSLTPVIIQWFVEGYGGCF